MNEANNMLRNYQGKRTLVTGGLGFIGSNLTIRLAELGARVTVIDSSVPGCGADEANLKPVRDSVTVLHRDIADTSALENHIRTADLVFNMAGEVSHTHSMKWPRRDAELNAVAQLRFLEGCARLHPGLRIVYAGTRQVYGRPRYLPVDENHPFCPVDFNGIHKGLAIQYHLLYAQLGKLDAVVLNLTNVYGPRMALWEPCQGFLGVFLRRMLQRQQLQIFGDGSQLRDPLYVDDAVDAFLMAGAAPQLPSRLYNLGGPEALSLQQIAETCSRLAGGPAPALRPFPPDHKKIDIGSYRADWTRIRTELGWQPRTHFTEGISRALLFYQAEPRYRLRLDDPGPTCGVRDELQDPLNLRRAAS